MQVGKCVRLWESPSPRLANARHGALAGVHTLYSLYIVSTCTKRRYERLAEALQLYSPLQPSTALQLYILYSIHPSTSPLRVAEARRGWWDGCTPESVQGVAGQTEGR